MRFVGPRRDEGHGGRGKGLREEVLAGHAVLRAAGGTVTTLDGEPLTYGKPGFDNPDFVAQGRRD